MPIFERAESSLNDSLLVDGSLEKSHDSSLEKSPLPPPTHEPEDNIPHHLDGEEEELSPASRTQQAMAPLWGRMYDDFFALGQLVGNFFSEEQVINLVKKVHGTLNKEANITKESSNLKKFNVIDFQRFLRASLGQVVRSSGDISYLALTELLAPDLLSRRALELFCALTDKTAEGVWVAQLQHALAFAQMSDRDIEQITGMPRCEYSRRAANNPMRERVKFSAFYKAVSRMKTVGDDGRNLNERARSAKRSKLERWMQAAHNAINEDDAGLPWEGEAVGEGSEMEVGEREGENEQGKSGFAYSEDVEAGVYMYTDGSPLASPRWQAGAEAQGSGEGAGGGGIDYVLVVDDADEEELGTSHFDRSMNRGDLTDSIDDPENYPLESNIFSRNLSRAGSVPPQTVPRPPLFTTLCVCCLLEPTPLYFPSFSPPPPLRIF